MDQTTVYGFDGRGSGTLHLPLGRHAFSYTIEEERLSIDFEDAQATDAAYRYSVDGSVLTLDGENGSVSGWRNRNDGRTAYEAQKYF